MVIGDIFGRIGEAQMGSTIEFQGDKYTMLPHRSVQATHGIFKGHLQPLTEMTRVLDEFGSYRYSNVLPETWVRLDGPPL